MEPGLIIGGVLSIATSLSGGKTATVGEGTGAAWDCGCVTFNGVEAGMAIFSALSSMALLGEAEEALLLAFLASPDGAFQGVPWCSITR